MEKDKFYQIGENLDALIKTDITGRGSIYCLYEAARKGVKVPLTLNFANALKNVIKPKDKVFLTTGWIDRPGVAPGFGETDGPGGTVVLARALRLMLNAACIIFTDRELVEGMKKVAQAAGFHCVDPEMLDASIEQNKLMTISILPFPVSSTDAKKEATRVLDEYKPVCCVSIERGGMNEKGRIHSMDGSDTSKTQAKVDYIFKEAFLRGIMTFGIGDGGNEIGMANIKECIYEHVKYGRECRCGCGKGIAPETIVNHLLTASISNWGCFAVVNMLAALKGNVKYLHTAEQEERILKNAADNGFHDAIYGGVEYSVDGCALKVDLSMVELLGEVVRQQIG